MARDVNKLIAPKQPTWQQALQQFIGRHRDRLQLAVAIDTGRSTRRSLDAFIGELQTILRHQTRVNTIRLLTFDRIVQQDFTRAVTQRPR